MANFQGMKLTKKGLALMEKLLVRELPTALTRIAIGDGILPPGERLEDMTGLVHETLSLPILTKGLISNEVVRIETRASSADFPDATRLHEVGLFATDPDEGEILYAADNATMGDTIPALGGGVFVVRVFRILITVANATEVIFTIDDAQATYALECVLEKKVSASNQDIFDLTVVDAKGTLSIFIDGLFTPDWTSPPGANRVVLENPVPEGLTVVFCETRLRLAG